MEQVYKRNDFIVKLFACLFIAIFLVFSFIGSRVFASSTSITPVNTDYNIELNENISQYFYIIFLILNIKIIFSQISMLKIVQAMWFFKHLHRNRTRF